MTEMIDGVDLRVMKKPSKLNFMIVITIIFEIAIIFLFSSANETSRMNSNIMIDWFLRALKSAKWNFMEWKTFQLNFLSFSPLSDEDEIDSNYRDYLLPSSFSGIPLQIWIALWVSDYHHIDDG